LVVAPSRSDLFFRSGSPAKRKVLLLGSIRSLSENLLGQLRSLQSEHVSPATLMRQEISRPAGSTPKAEKALLVALRRWFWMRKPDAGFVLTDFPATLLQAMIFDEWLDARNEALDAVFVGENTSAELIEYYRNHGLLVKVF
jgi:adenylate kinase